MKTSAIFFQLLLISFPLFAQSDSATVINAGWKVEKVVRGVILKQHRFDNALFNSSQNVSILEIKQGGKRFFDMAYKKKELRKTSDFGKSANAIAALNGTFFDVKNGGSVDYLRADGKIVNQTRIGANGRVGHPQSAILIRKGKIRLAKWNGTPDWEHNLIAEDVMVTGPLLILSKQAENLDTANLFNKTRHPRTALAITKNRRLLFITIDGRNENAAGMSLFELTKLLKWLKTLHGINLDGGGSTTLWVRGFPGNGVVNYPSDNKTWDHDGERKVANTLLLITR